MVRTARTGANGANGAIGATGATGAAGPTGTPGTPAVGQKLIGATMRTIHAPKIKGMKFVSVRAKLHNKPLPVRGRSVKVDLRGKVAGNYNVFDGYQVQEGRQGPCCPQHP